MAKVMTFAAAMLDYFGKNGKTAMEFMAEMKALTDEDREWFRANLATVGYEITN